jgi:hypothetical protein
MQDRSIISSDDAQQRIPFVALYQGQPAYGTNSQALPPASSDVFNLNIDKLYIFRGANEITSFLEENPFLIPLLQEAYTHIKRHFPLSDIVLEVVTDPEVIGEKQLVAFIVVDKNAKGASLALDHLDEEWGLEAMESVQDKLCITLEFK